VRFSASTAIAVWLGSLTPFVSGRAFSAEENPLFRFEESPLKEPRLKEQPVNWSPMIVPRPRFRPPVVRPLPTLPYEQSLSVAFRETPVKLRRHPLREITLATEDEPCTIRTPESSPIDARLSLGVQTEFRATDNVANVPNARATSEMFHDLTPIVRLTLGDNPDNRPWDWTEKEGYLDVLYAPTWHRLLEAQTMQFLHYLNARVGRLTPLLHTGARFVYDDNLFASQEEGSPEDNFTMREIVPFIEYRPSQVTILHVRGEYRQLQLQNPVGDRSEWVADAGVDVVVSAKTTVGLSAQMGRIEYDQPQLGMQYYSQGFLSMVWLPTQKVTFQTRVGVELREFDRPKPLENQWSPLATAFLSWQPTERTRLAGTFGLRNYPSIVRLGSLVTDMRFGLDVTQDLGSRFYGRVEAESIHRDYNAGFQEWELTARPALGYRLTSSELLDAAQIEVFYQFRRRLNNGFGDDFVRHQAGVQLTVFF
jgi:hypothetical protein